MSFSHPWWFLAGGLALAAMMWTWRIADARQRDSLRLFIGSRLRAQLTRSISITRRNIRRALFATAVILLVAALAGPRAGYHWEQVTRRGNDIIFAVDTSRSMATPDVKPNRLARAKLAIDDFVARLDGDAVGLVAFAGSAFLQCPVTLDYGAFRESLAALDTHIIPRGGTNITSAIHEAQAALQKRPDSDKVMILITDGEDLEGDALAAAKTAAKQDGLKIYAVGVGSANGDLIPLPADQGGGYLRDSTGQLVKSHLDAPALQALAAATGGTYAALGAENQGLDTIYKQALAPLARRELESRSQRIYTERYQWPLAASLVLLLGSLMLGMRRRVAVDEPAPEAAPARRAAAAPRRFAAPALSLLCAMGGLVLAPRAHASPASAAQAYARGDFPAAQKQFAEAAAGDPTHPVLQYDAGAAAYRAGAYPQAAQAFLASVNAAQSGKASRLSEQQDAYYNLGNALYREGQATEASNHEATLDSWTRAVKAYDAALQLRTDDVDSRYNRDLVKRKLEALKKQQSQKKQKPQDQPKSADNANDKQPKPQSSKDKTGGDSKQQQPKSGEKQDGQPQQAKGPSQGQDKGGKPQQAGGPTPQPGPKQGQPSNQPPGAAPPQQASRESPAPPSPRPDHRNGTGGAQQAQTAQSGDDQRTPDGMSRQEARELLDSVRNEEKHPPVAPLARNGSDDDTVDEPLKDW